MYLAELAEQKKTLAEQQTALDQKDAEIAALRKALERYQHNETGEG